MLGTSPHGLTAHDFHPQIFVDPRDVFLSKSRQSSRTRNKAASGIKAHSSSLSPSTSSHPPACCGEPEKLGCVNLSEDDPGSPESCEGECDKCEDCFEDHKVCDEDEIQCVDECDDCLDEHDAACGQHGQVCTEDCNDCDFSCFDCIDWDAFEKDKSLGLSYSVPLLDQSALHADTSFDALLSNDIMDFEIDSNWQNAPVPPIEIPVHHNCLTDTTSYWNLMTQAQLCSPDAPVVYPPRDQRFMTTLPTSYGCHPATAHRPTNQQQPLPAYNLQASLAYTPSGAAASIPQYPLPQIKSETLETSTKRICQWLMPCGTTCSASFASTADLKKHLKTVHTLKGTTSCRWASCSATFASEAALTGHISKKHLSATTTDSEGAFPCTFPNCTKSFMYKQVRDEHIASCHNGNKMYCDICKQWLNAEGSNFKRHMASHQPKHQHMICKWHHLGCKRRFPRLDNLRRHEGCCKFGKKAALHHHHHHRHVAH